MIDLENQPAAASFQKPVDELIEESAKSETGVSSSSVTLGGVNIKMAVSVCGSHPETRKVVNYFNTCYPNVGYVLEGAILKDLYAEAQKAQAITVFKDLTQTYIILVSDTPEDTAKLESFLEF